MGSEVNENVLLVLGQYSCWLKICEHFAILILLDLFFLPIHLGIIWIHNVAAKIKLMIRSNLDLLDYRKIKGKIIILC